MKRLLVLALVVGLSAVLTSCSQTRSPRNVLYYADNYSGTDYISQALAAENVTTATSWSDFDTKLAAGNYDLAIALGQSNAANPDLTTLTNYVSGGGRLIFADESRGTAYDNLLEVTYTGNTNESTMTLDAPLNQGVADPMTLSNLWAAYSMGLQPQGPATSLCTFAAQSDSCLVVGNSGRTVTLGFLADTPPAADGVTLFKNIIAFVDP